MPLNKGKSCRLCGSTKHTLATCCCRGAPEFRKLLKANQCKAKSKQSRTCRGTGTAAARKRGAKPAKKVAVSSRKRQAIARANYSGDKKTFDQRHDRQCSGGSVCSQPEKALEELLSLGFVKRPGQCSSCGVGQLLGPVPRHDAGSEGSLYYRCSNWECKKYTNCLSLQTWLYGLGRFGLLTPVRLLGIIKVYATRKYPRPQCVAFGFSASFPAQIFFFALTAFLPLTVSKDHCLGLITQDKNGSSFVARLVKTTKWCTW